jgi:sarcosine oxidase
MKKFQTIVVGLGAMGSAAVYQLSKRGNHVLGIDQYAPPHLLGSTHGDTRITRQAIGEGIAYTPIVLRANEIWRELEEKVGKELYTTTGGLIMGDTSNASVVHGNTSFLQLTLDSAKQYGIKHEVLTSSEIRHQFPQFNVRDHELGYYEYGAGFLRPELCVEAQLGVAQAQGAEIHTNEKVISYERVGGSVHVRTDQGEYWAEKLVICAGPWVKNFLDESLGSLFKVYHQVLYWFDVGEQYERFKTGTCPVFIWEFGTADDDGIYGFPAIDGRNGGIKIAAEDYEVSTSPEVVNRSVTALEIAEMYARHVEPYIKGVGEMCVRAVSCLYTVTADSNFIIDFHPEFSQVIVASPCSGHGFKHSAAIGEILADMVIQGESKLDISAFRIPKKSL